MKDKICPLFTVRTKVVSVEFKCSNYARTAIPYPEFSDQVFRVEPLWTTSLDDVISTMEGAGGVISLRWFDSESVYNDNDLIRIKKGGTMELQVKVYYVSVQLDRQDKLDSLGV